MQTYSFGLILSNKTNFECVKRYVQLGLQFKIMGHNVTIFTPDGSLSDCNGFGGKIVPLRDLLLHEFDIVMTSEVTLAATLLLCRSKLKVFYAISSDRQIRAIARFPEIEFFTHSAAVTSFIRKTVRKKPFQAYGGFHGDDASKIDTLKQNRPLIINLLTGVNSNLKELLPVIRACEKLCRSGYNIQLSITSVGGSVDNAILEKYTNKIPCTFQENTGHAASAAHVYVTLDRFTGWSDPVIDAIKSGVAVVYSKDDTPDLLIHNQTALRVSHNPESIASAIKHLYDNPALQVKLSDNARKLLLSYTWESCANGIIGYVRSTLESADASYQSIPLSHCIHHGHLVAPADLSLKPDMSLNPGIYVFCYHGVAPKNARDEWEQAYSDVITDADIFEQHIEWLNKRAKPLRLSQVNEMLSGGVREPHFVITFDDGFRNNALYAKPILDVYGIKPTVFVNSAYSIDGAVFHRVLASMLIKRGFEKLLLKSVESEYGTRLHKRNNIMKSIKRDYRYQKTEQAVENAWKVQCNALPQNIYLSIEELKGLALDGWEIGNHTHSHVKLSALTATQQACEIEHCEEKLLNSGITVNSWIAYPYGSPSDINDDTLSWLSRNTSYNGLFCHSGFNIFHTRSQWLRIGIGNQSIENFIGTINDAVFRTPCGNGLH